MSVKDKETKAGSLHNFSCVVIKHELMCHCRRKFPISTDDYFLNLTQFHLSGLKVLPHILQIEIESGVLCDLTDLWVLNQFNFHRGIQLSLHITRCLEWCLSGRRFRLEMMETYEANRGNFRFIYGTISFKDFHKFSYGIISIFPLFHRRIIIKSWRCFNCAIEMKISASEESNDLIPSKWFINS